MSQRRARRKIPPVGGTQRDSHCCSFVTGFGFALVAAAYPRYWERRATAPPAAFSFRSRRTAVDTPREVEFDDIVKIAAQVCDAPIALVNLIDEARQWFKAEVGMGARETPLEEATYRVSAPTIAEPAGPISALYLR